MGSEEGGKRKEERGKRKEEGGKRKRGSRAFATDRWLLTTDH
jgi:hypothetical protein